MAEARAAWKRQSWWEGTQPLIVFVASSHVIAPNEYSPESESSPLHAALRVSDIKTAFEHCKSIAVPRFITGPMCRMAAS